MSRCYLKRSAKTAAALVVAFLMVIAMLDTRSRYSSFMMPLDSSDPYPSGESGGRRGGGELINFSRLVRIHSSNKTDAHNQLIHSKPGGGGTNDNEISNDISSEVLLTGGGQFPLDNGTMTLRFWDLVNGSSRGRGLATKGIFTETAQLPNLWRPQMFDPDYLLTERDDDRVLAQLIWAMEASNLTESGWPTKVCDSRFY